MKHLDDTNIFYKNQLLPIA